MTPGLDVRGLQVTGRASSSWRGHTAPPGQFTIANGAEPAAGTGACRGLRAARGTGREEGPRVAAVFWLLL